MLKIKETWPAMGAPAPFLLKLFPKQPVFQPGRIYITFGNELDFVKIFVVYTTKLDEYMFIWRA